MKAASVTKGVSGEAEAELGTAAALFGVMLKLQLGMPGLTKGELPQWFGEPQAKHGAREVKLDEMNKLAKSPADPAAFLGI